MTLRKLTLVVAALAAHQISAFTVSNTKLANRVQLVRNGSFATLLSSAIPTDDFGDSEDVSDPPTSSVTKDLQADVSYWSRFARRLQTKEDTLGLHKFSSIGMTLTALGIAGTC